MGKTLFFLKRSLILTIILFASSLAGASAQTGKNYYMVNTFQGKLEKVDKTGYKYTVMIVTRMYDPKLCTFLGPADKPFEKGGMISCHVGNSLWYAKGNITYDMRYAPLFDKKEPDSKVYIYFKDAAGTECLLFFVDNRSTVPNGIVGAMVEDLKKSGSKDIKTVYPKVRML